VSPVKYELGFYIPEYAILYSHRRENLKSYIVLLFLRGVLRLLVTTNFVSSSPIPDTLKMKAIRSPRTSALIRARRRNISEDDILHSPS
jgi:hypothetical protein